MFHRTDTQSSIPDALYHYKCILQQGINNFKLSARFTEIYSYCASPHMYVCPSRLTAICRLPFELQVVNSLFTCCAVVLQQCCCCCFCFFLLPFVYPLSLHTNIRAASNRYRVYRMCNFISASSARLTKSRICEPLSARSAATVEDSNSRGRIGSGFAQTLKASLFRPNISCNIALSCMSFPPWELHLEHLNRRYFPSIVKNPHPFQLPTNERAKPAPCHCDDSDSSAAARALFLYRASCASHSDSTQSLDHQLKHLEKTVPAYARFVAPPHGSGNLA